MTYEQIMALEGRELDVAVQQHVIGADKVTRHMGSAPVRTTEDGVPVPRGDYYYYSEPKPSCKCWRVPDYSTSIAAAWQVVENIPWPISLDNGSGRDWSCQVWVGIGLVTHGKTAPETICRAALLAHFTGGGDE